MSLVKFIVIFCEEAFHFRPMRAFFEPAKKKILTLNSNKDNSKKYFKTFKKCVIFSCFIFPL